MQPSFILENGSKIYDFHHNNKKYTVIEIPGKGMIASCDGKYMEVDQSVIEQLIQI